MLSRGDKNRPSGRIHPYQRNTDDAVPIIGGGNTITAEHATAIQGTKDMLMKLKSRQSHRNRLKHIYKFWSEKYVDYYNDGTLLSPSRKMILYSFITLTTGISSTMDSMWNACWHFLLQRSIRQTEILLLCRPLRNTTAALTLWRVCTDQELLRKSNIATPLSLSCIWCLSKPQL
jgi:hypothetical protein